MDAIGSVASGNTLDEAYRTHGPQLLRRLSAMTGDAELAQDLAQEAFARLARELGAGRPPDNAGAWLQSVGANLARSRGRREQVAGRHRHELLGDGTVESPESAVINAERSGELWRALGQLSSIDRRAVLLAAHGYRGPEIAALLGRSDGAVRTRLHRARLRLRSELLANS